MRENKLAPKEIHFIEKRSQFRLPKKPEISARVSPEVQEMLTGGNFAPRLCFQPMHLESKAHPILFGYYHASLMSER
jgi:hypothetical protein